MITTLEVVVSKISFVSSGSSTLESIQRVLPNEQQIAASCNRSLRSGCQEHLTYEEKDRQGEIRRTLMAHKEEKDRKAVSVARRRNNKPSGV